MEPARYSSNPIKNPATPASTKDTIQNAKNLFIWESLFSCSCIASTAAATGYLLEIMEKNIPIIIKTGSAAIANASSHQNAKEIMLKKFSIPGNHQDSQEAAFVKWSKFETALIVISPMEI